MKPSVSALVPIIRSDALGRMLSELYLNPGMELTASEIARRTQSSLSNASRELTRLETAGYVRSRRSGRNRYLTANAAHPLFAPISAILLHAYGPLAVLPRFLSGVRGIEEAYIYGSWAARLLGEEGRDPDDIDVLAIGSSVDLNDLEVASESARALLRRDVNARAVTRAAWDAPNDLFLAHVRERPLVTIPLDPDPGAG
jgi:DNA-binding transcriptional ArsR family regulator